jgi:nitrogen fixation NifU-like protein
MFFQNNIGWATAVDKDLDQIADEIQKAILDDARRIYSEKVIDHFLHPRNVGGIEDADGFARIKGPCGDTVYIFLKVNGARITDAKFLTDGCGTTIACGSVVTELIKGKEIKDALKIRHTHVLAAVGGLPEADVHCALLAAGTLHEAIKNYRLKKRSKGKNGREFQKRE